MKKVKLKFSKLPVPEQIQKARDIVTRLTGNSDFPSPSPSLSSVTQAVNELESAHNDAADGSRLFTSVMHAKAKALADLMVLLAAYVQQASGGDEQKILGSGMEEKAAGAHNARTFTAKPGENEGEVMLTAASVKHGTHRWQYCPDPPPLSDERSAQPGNTWVDAGMSTKAVFVVTGLPSGTKMWFRHAAVTPSGQGPWSNPAKVLVP